MLLTRITCIGRRPQLFGLRTWLIDRHAGLVEIRTIPAKKDIAFVEFSDEATAGVAKDALHNFKIDGETKMKVSFGRAFIGSVWSGRVERHVSLIIGHVR